MQGILLGLLRQEALGHAREGGLCRKRFLVGWSRSSLELEAGLKLHQDFDDVVLWQTKLCTSLFINSLYIHPQEAKNWYTIWIRA